MDHPPSRICYMAQVNHPLQILIPFVIFRPTATSFAKDYQRLRSKSITQWMLAVRLWQVCLGTKLFAIWSAKLVCERQFSFFVPIYALPALTIFASSAAHMSPRETPTALRALRQNAITQRRRSVAFSQLVS